MIQDYVKQNIENYKKPTPPKWRKIGDFALLLIPVFHTSIGNAPEGTFTTRQLYWIGLVLTTFPLAIKFWTSTKVEELTQE